MIKEVIVVEGKCDIAAVRRAVDADCLATGGYSLLKQSLSNIEAAYNKRGIIILTDPDSAGERIRQYLITRFPAAKQAYIPKQLARSTDDIGVECASVKAISEALTNARCCSMEKRQEFSMQDVCRNGLTGVADSSVKRGRLCAVLGLGDCNAKQLVVRLNNFGITRAEFIRALEQIND